MNKEFKKILKTNAWLIIVPLVLNIILILPHPYPPEPKNHQFIIPYFAYTGLFILLIAAINLMIAIVLFILKNQKAKYYLLAAGLALLIGFSVCSLP